jgi:lysophospholipase L1-like esterase
LHDDEDQTVVLTDNGAGGTFSPSATAILNTDNSYTAEVIYTPAQAGLFNISATASDFDGQLESNIFVSPYSTTIGFIGDSITAGNKCSSGNYPPVEAVNELASGFTAINRGISNVTTTTYLLGTNWTSAVNQFNAGGVEVVHIMLGTNDIGDNSITAAVYKENMQTIIDRLFAQVASVKKIIISDPMALLANQAPARNKRAEISVVIDELVNGETVLRGDKEAYAYFQANLTSLTCDNTHPNQVGNVQLGTYWANAIRADLEYQISPAYEWLTDDNEFDQDNDSEDATLTFSIDKYLGEFSDVVKVDGQTLESSNYTATAGSTIIELTNAFLNSLAAGNHTLAVAFHGGVNVNSQFTILAANNSGGNNNNNNNGGDSGGNNSNSSDSVNTPFSPITTLSSPSTGLFGTSATTTALVSGLVTVISALVIVLIGHKLLQSAD